FEITVGSGHATFADSNHVAIDRRAHRASRLTPLEPSIDENLRQPFLFRLAADTPGTGDDHRSDAFGHLEPFHMQRRASQIADAGIRARADEDVLDREI